MNQNETGRIVVSTNMTLDGVIEDPTGDEGFAHGGWFEEMSEADRAVWATIETQEVLSASALLLGGGSYEWFARRWAGREGVWGEGLQALPKYVVSRRAVTTPWGPVTMLGGDPAAEVRALKGSVTGEILVFGSGHLLGTLFDNDLVDELRLFVFPAALGSGRRLFEDLDVPQVLDLVRVESLGDGVVQLGYRVRTDQLTSAGHAAHRSATGA
jgi:dihydrofolate reductase